MFGWLRGNRQRRLNLKSPTLSADIGNAVADFGALMEKAGAMSIRDTSALPLPKEDMKIALKLAWKFSPDDQTRRAIEGLYPVLAWFREGIGPTPINAEFPDPDKITKEILSASAKYLALASEARREMSELSSEIEIFISGEAASR